VAVQHSTKKAITCNAIYSNMCASNSRRLRISSLSVIVWPVCRGVDGFSGVCTRVPTPSRVSSLLSPSKVVSETSGDPGMGVITRCMAACSGCRLGTNVIPVSSVSVSDVRGDPNGCAVGVKSVCALSPFLSLASGIIGRYLSNA